MEELKHQIKTKTQYLEKYLAYWEKAEQQYRLMPENIMLQRRLWALEHTIEVTLDHINYLRDQLNKLSAESGNAS